MPPFGFQFLKNTYFAFNFISYWIKRAPTVLILQTFFANSITLLDGNFKSYALKQIPTVLILEIDIGSSKPWFDSEHLERNHL